MTAIRFVARIELRRRWRVYGLLAVLLGVPTGLAIAGFDGAERSIQALRDWDAATDDWDVALVPNDPSFGPEQRATVASIDGVRRAEAFSIGALELLVDGRARLDFWPGLMPRQEPGLDVQGWPYPIATGRHVDPGAADEIEIDENARRAYGLDIGETIELHDVSADVRHALRVVGIVHSPERAEGGTWYPSPGFIAAHPEIETITNVAVWLDDPTDEEAFLAAAARELGVEVVPSISLSREARELSETARFEGDASRIWAIAVALAVLALVGQAFMRTVTVAAIDQRVLGDLGMDRRERRLAAALPAIVAIGASVPVALAAAAVASERFPIGMMRGYALDRGVHLDPVVTTLGVATSVAVATALSLTAAGLRRPATTTGPRRLTRRSPAWLVPGPVPFRLGLRLAASPGRGTKAIPTRSAALGLAGGVLGVMAAFTFRAGLQTMLEDPSRAGVLGEITAAPPFGETPAPGVVDAVVADPGVTDVVAATWHRVLEVDGTNVSTWTLVRHKGDADATVVAGRRPDRPGEIALAPDTMRELDVRVGDEVAVGPQDLGHVVVGEVLLPNDSHQGYRSGALMTPAGFVATGSPDDDSFGATDGLYIETRSDAASDAIVESLSAEGWQASDTVPPIGFERLRRTRFLSLGFSVFLAALGLASLVHALVLAVRRRRADFAVLRALGLSGGGIVAVVVALAGAITTAALVIGLPGGAAAGRWVTGAVVATYSFVDRSPAVVLIGSAVAGAVVVVCLLVAVPPGMVAGHSNATESLRAD